jgi:hypothetical protein
MTRPRHRFAIPARGEDGYAVVVTVTIALVLTMLLVVVLSQALHNNTATTVEARRSRALGVSEAGVHWAIARLQDPATAVVANQSVTVADPVPGGSGGTGTATVTVRQGTPTNPSRLGFYTIYSTGQVAEANSPIRTLRVTMGPAASFTYALYSDSSLSLEGNACIVGTVYAKGDIRFGGKATVAGTTKARGSLISEAGSLEFTGGKPQCPVTVDDEPVDTSNDIHADAFGSNLTPCTTAAGHVTRTDFDADVGGLTCDTVADPYEMPEFNFDPLNYGGNVPYYGRPSVVAPGTASATAVTDFNAALQNGSLPQAAGGGLNRAYVIWQDLSGVAAGADPPKVSLDVGTLRIAADTVIYTNVPVDFGNTSGIEATNPSCSKDPAVAPACPTLQVISAYAGTPCGAAAGEGCPAISGKNQIEAAPEVAMLLYSREGIIQFKNGCNGPRCDDSNNGSWYAGRIEGKNNLNISYSPRIAYALGFGRTRLQQVSWQELAPCPAGQTPPAGSATC